MTLPRTMTAMVTMGHGDIRPVLAATYPLDRLHEAQTAFIAKRHTGNIVVVPGT